MGGIRFFLKKWFRTLFNTDGILASSKKIEKTNDTISKKAQKAYFLGLNLPKNAECDFFFENWAPSLFKICEFASLCKKSEKINDPV